MLIEYRAYTMRPGCADEFLQIFWSRGIDPIKRPILGRLIGYFKTLLGEAEQVVHLWRFDSYDDWMARLHAPDPSRAEYFDKVRPLMLRQESRFMLPAPLENMTPIWGNGNDWLPSDGPLPRLKRIRLVEESTINLFPGSLPLVWDAYRKLGHQGGELLGTFYTLVGRQHQVTLLSGFEDAGQYSQHRAQSALAERESAFVAERQLRLLHPVAYKGLSPLFADA